MADNANANTNANDDRSGRLQGVAERAHGLVDQAKDGATSRADRVVQAAHQGIDRAATTASDAADWVTQKTDEYTRMPQEMLESACDTIRARPLAAVGAALAVGYLFGRLGR